MNLISKIITYLTINSILCCLWNTIDPFFHKFFLFFVSSFIILIKGLFCICSLLFQYLSNCISLFSHFVYSPNTILYILCADELSNLIIKISCLTINIVISLHNGFTYCVIFLLITYIFIRLYYLFSQLIRPILIGK